MGIASYLAVSSFFFYLVWSSGEYEAQQREKNKATVGQETATGISARRRNGEMRDSPGWSHGKEEAKAEILVLAMVTKGPGWFCPETVGTKLWLPNPSFQTTIRYSGGRKRRCAAMREAHRALDGPRRSPPCWKTLTEAL